MVTGANGGLGYQTTLRLVERGASVVMACRDERKGLAALERIRDEVPDARADVRVLDLAAFESVRSFAATVEEPLDLLVNNAGVMAIRTAGRATGSRCSSASTTSATSP